MDIHKIYRFFMARFRPGRIKQLKSSFPQINGTGQILDVGGTSGWWQMVQPKNKKITIINLDGRQRAAVLAAGFGFAVADARALPYKDDEFDLVISNSVIEHVGGWEDQKRCAQEMLRCGRAVYVQTPNFWFPIEPHLIAPFIHWLPRPALRLMVRWFSVWGWVTKPSQEQVDIMIDSIHLLSRKDIVSLFPGCEIVCEKFLFLSKSYIVMRRNVADRGASA